MSGKRTVQVKLPVCLPLSPHLHLLLPATSA
jgi:hypothetical protein